MNIVELPQGYVHFILYDEISQRGADLCPWLDFSPGRLDQRELVLIVNQVVVSFVLHNQRRLALFLLQYLKRNWHTLIGGQDKGRHFLLNVAMWLRRGKNDHDRRKQLSSETQLIFASELHKRIILQNSKKSVKMRKRVKNVIPNLNAT